MSEEANMVRVQVKYRDSELTFEGTVEETWILLNKFYNECVPAFKVASELWLSVDLLALARDCEGIIVFSPEGANVIVPKTKLTDNETLALWLLAGYLGKQLKLFDKDVFSKEELQLKLGKSSKITSTRLGELVKTDWVSKTADDKFKMTTFGVAQMQKDVLPRIIAKAEI